MHPQHHQTQQSHCLVVWISTALQVYSSVAAVSHQVSFQPCIITQFAVLVALQQNCHLTSQTWSNISKFSVISKGTLTPLHLTRKHSVSAQPCCEIGVKTKIPQYLDSVTLSTNIDARYHTARCSGGIWWGAIATANTCFYVHEEYETLRCIRSELGVYSHCVQHEVERWLKQGHGVDGADGEK